MDRSIKLALRRSQGKPIVDKNEQQVSDIIDANYRNAVIALRRHVEQNGQNWREALDEVRQEIPLSMFQVQEIEDKAAERWGEQS